MFYERKRKELEEKLSAQKEKANRELDMFKKYQMRGAVKKEKKENDYPYFNPMDGQKGETAMDMIRKLRKRYKIDENSATPNHLKNVKSTLITRGTNSTP